VHSEQHEEFMSPSDNFCPKRLGLDLRQLHQRNNEIVDRCESEGEAWSGRIKVNQITDNKKQILINTEHRQQIIRQTCKSIA